MFNTKISILLNTEILKFNSIEYWKRSIPKFQYYWIPKKFQYWSSIIPKFSVLLPKIPNFQMSWILRKIFLEKLDYKFLLLFLVQKLVKKWLDDSRIVWRANWYLLEVLKGGGLGSQNSENTGKYRSSIVLNTENVQYWNFNTIEYRNTKVQ